jgi:23S rRNA pseudouridine1911/1915/1917 synthase
MTTQHTLLVGEQNAGMRLDKFLVASLPELSRSRLQSLILEGHVACNGKAIDTASGKVKSGQEYTVTIPDIVPSHLVAQDIALDIVYEDEHLLVINKPAGLTVHPGAGNPDMTLVNALLNYCGDSLSGIGGVARPGIVHRIDKETSGLLVVAKNDAAHAHLSEQLATRTLKRTYAAVVWGVPKPAASTVTGNIGRAFSNRQKMAVVKTGGKPATTHYKTIKDFSSLFAHVECNLETGRTHQIRVHMAHIKHPLIGDPVYGPNTKQKLAGGAYKHLPPQMKATLLAFNRQALHAKALELIHPVTGKKMSFSSELPTDIKSLLAALDIVTKTSHYK